MRNIHLFKQFMLENGIEYGVPFTVEIKNGDKLVTENLVLRSIGCGGTDIDVIDADTNKRRLCADDIIFMLLFLDSVKIVKNRGSLKKVRNIGILDLTKTITVTLVLAIGIIIHLILQDILLATVLERKKKRLNIKTTLRECYVVNRL